MPVNLEMGLRPDAGEPSGGILREPKARRIDADPEQRCALALLADRGIPAWQVGHVVSGEATRVVGSHPGHRP